MIEVEMRRGDGAVIIRSLVRPYQMFSLSAHPDDGRNSKDGNMSVTSTVTRGNLVIVAPGQEITVILRNMHPKEDA